MIRKSRIILSMLQGTMALEGQGLPREILRAMHKRTVRELLGAAPCPTK